MELKNLVLIVEDEKGIRSLITTVLTSNNFDVIQTDRGQEAVAFATSKCPDLILLDLGLPDMDGIEVLKILNEIVDIPIIIVSARGTEREKVQALELGADDYITKPFGTAEMLARIKNSIRRNKKSFDSKDDGPKIIHINDLAIDDERRIVTIENNVIHLTPIEYKILLVLANNIGKVLTHDYIIKQVWGVRSNESQTLRVNMANLRRKIEKNPGEPVYILTEVGVGYRMTDFS